MPKLHNEGAFGKAGRRLHCTMVGRRSESESENAPELDEPTRRASGFVRVTVVSESATPDVHDEPTRPGLGRTQSGILIRGEQAPEQAEDNAVLADLSIADVRMNAMREPYASGNVEAALALASQVVAELETDASLEEPFSENLADDDRTTVLPPVFDPPRSR